MYKVSSSSSTKCMLSGAPGRLERVRAFSEVLCQPHLHHSEVLVLVVLVDKGKGHSGTIQGKTYIWCLVFEVNLPNPVLLCHHPRE